MTTNKPKVLAYHVNTENPEHAGVILEALIRLSDYETLQAECEKLRKDVAKLVDALEEARHYVAVSPAPVREGFTEELDVALAARQIVAFTK